MVFLNLHLFFGKCQCFVIIYLKNKESKIMLMLNLFLVSCANSYFIIFHVFFNNSYSCYSKANSLNIFPLLLVTTLLQAGIPGYVVCARLVSGPTTAAALAPSLGKHGDLEPVYVCAWPWVQWTIATHILASQGCCDCPAKASNQNAGSHPGMP